MRSGGSRLKPLLTRGANINSKDAYARGPLYVLAIEGSDVIYKLLLDLGADADVMDSWGRTASQ